MARGSSRTHLTIYPNRCSARGSARFTESRRSPAAALQPRAGSSEPRFSGKRAAKGNGPKTVRLMRPPKTTRVIIKTWKTPQDVIPETVYSRDCPFLPSNYSGFDECDSCDPESKVGCTLAFVRTPTGPQLRRESGSFFAGNLWLAFRATCLLY